MAREEEQAPKIVRLPVRVQAALVMLPAMVSYVVLARMYTAVPVIDDYPYIFAFALSFQRVSTVAAKAALIFTAQVGSYKLILLHLLVGLQLLIFGRLNFPVLIALGDLSLMGIFAVLSCNAAGGRSNARERLILLLPVSFLLFSLNYAETVDWAMAGLQPPTCILFSLAASHFLVKPKRNRWDILAACVFGALASASNANGMIVWPVGLGFLLLQDRRPLRLVVWCSAFAVTLGAFLFHRQPETATGHATVLGKTVFFVMFCGSALENMHHRPVPYVSVAIGLSVLSVLVHAIRTRYYSRNPFFFCAAVWVLLTGAVIANARMAMGLQLAMSSRYKIYCDLLLIFCYEYLLDRIFVKRGNQGVSAASGWRRRWLIAAFAGAAVVFVAGDFAGAKLLKTRRERAEGAMRRYLVAPQSASPMFLVEDVLNPAEVMEEERARQELTEAIRVGIYVPPTWMVTEAASQGRLAVARPEWFAAGTLGSDGRWTYPAEALAGAYRATAAWGTILLGDASYVSPFYDVSKRDACSGAMTPYVAPRRFVGVGRPGVDDERRPQRLVGGSMILGEVCGSAALQMAHLGVDAGPGVVRELYGGVKSNGIYLPSHGGFNPKRGTRLEDVSVLTNDMDGQHSVLIEGEEGAVVDGLWVWVPGGTHGMILKSAHSTVRDYHCRGAKSDCLLVKSDYMTAANGNATEDVLEGIHLRYMEKPGDTGGISLDGTWDTVSNIQFRDVEEDGLRFGLSGGGSWFHRVKGVRVDGWRAREMMGPCTAFGQRIAVTISHADCEVASTAAVNLHLERRSFARWWKDSYAAVKPELRILWEMLVTWVVLAWRWVMAKIFRGAEALA